MKPAITFNGKPISELNPKEILEWDLLRGYKAQKELDRKFKAGEPVYMRGISQFIADEGAES